MGRVKGSEVRVENEESKLNPVLQGSLAVQKVLGCPFPLQRVDDGVDQRQDAQHQDQRHSHHDDFHGALCFIYLQHHVHLVRPLFRCLLGVHIVGAILHLVLVFSFLLVLFFLLVLVSACVWVEGRSVGPFPSRVHVCVSVRIQVHVATHEVSQDGFGVSRLTLHPVVIEFPVLAAFVEVCVSCRGKTGC